mmetsp:Transcript_14670/g.50088  ORF Transcript_14670/g.50088 Transcript_14670/m.50088 type:complete len:365 (+) Transcript_14670:281-1375(+)
MLSKMSSSSSSSLESSGSPTSFAAEIRLFSALSALNESLEADPASGLAPRPEGVSALAGVERLAEGFFSGVDVLSAAAGKPNPPDEAKENEGVALDEPKDDPKEVEPLVEAPKPEEVDFVANAIPKVGAVLEEEAEDEGAEEELDGLKEKSEVPPVPVPNPELVAGGPNPEDPNPELVAGVPNPKEVVVAEPVLASPNPVVPLAEDANENPPVDAFCCAAAVPPPCAAFAQAGVSTSLMPVVSQGLAEAAGLDAAGAACAAGAAGAAAGLDSATPFDSADFDASGALPPTAALAQAGVSTGLIPVVSQGLAEEAGWAAGVGLAGAGVADGSVLTSVLTTGFSFSLSDCFTAALGFSAEAGCPAL